MENLESLSRQRLDFSIGPKGEDVATLTITLQDGSVHVFSQSVDADEVAAYGAAIAAAEARQARIEGVGEHEISGLFSSVGSAFKSVYRKGQKIASSKVFKWAGKGLVVAGAVFPPAAAVGAGMLVASKLSDASLAAEAKAKRVARALAKAAKKTAKAASKKGGIRLGALLKYANKRRKGAKRRVGKKRRRRGLFGSLSRAGRKVVRKKKKKKRRTKVKRRTVRRRTKAPSPLRAAKRGTLRSNKPGGVTSGELKRAAKRGRIFWVA